MWNPQHGTIKYIFKPNPCKIILMKGAISLEMIILIVLIIAVIAIVGNVIMTSSKNAATEITNKSNMILREVSKSCMTDDDCTGGTSCINGVCSNNSSAG